MPFDGLNYLDPAAKPSLWTRLRSYVTGDAPAVKMLPPHLFQPMPLREPDGVTLQTLTIGRALIEDRRDWVQRRYETRDGRRCAVGALRAANRLLQLPTQPTGANALLLSVAVSRGFNDIESMNDNSTHRQILSAFDEAIARAARPA